MIHITLHFFVPLLVAIVFYRNRWRVVTSILVATMVVDVDHLLADPIYDPSRCSIGFHPLHTVPAILVYLGFFLLPLLLKSDNKRKNVYSVGRMLQVVGLGLLIHMALDGVDCWL